MATIKDDLKSFRRSWVYHTGMQLATLTVLASTSTVIAFGLAFSLNLKRILASWGDGTQIVAYLAEDTSEVAVQDLRNTIEAMSGVKATTFIGREAATENFKTQMASYAPDLLADAEFAHPFPASIRVAVRGGVATEDDVKRLEQLASSLQKMPGIEDVSYGQSWVKNYSSFVTTLYAGSGVMAVILMAGSLFVIGNSIRASISVRREEIAILELVGATASMIRRPYVIEGLIMGALAAMMALGFNFGLHVWQKSMMSGSLVLARLVPLMSFLNPVWSGVFIICGALLGASGAWLTVRKINDGWSAKQGLESA